MAWNPSPEVAVARDAAKRLGDADQCIVLWIKGQQLGMASFGRTKQLCAEARPLGEACYRAIQDELIAQQKLYGEAT